MTSKKSIFETKQIFYCVSRWHSYMIGCDFNLHYIIYWKLLIDNDNLYSKNEENGQKLRHYDVINMWKWHFTKKLYFFQISRHIFFKIGWVDFPYKILVMDLFCKKCYFLCFCRISLINPLLKCQIT